MVRIFWIIIFLSPFAYQNCSFLNLSESALTKFAATGGADSLVQQSSQDMNPPTPTPDMSPSPTPNSSPTPSPTPSIQIFSVNTNECNGVKCSGGYNGNKNSSANNAKTATKLCQNRGFTSMVDWTIGGQPGGAFCSFNGGTYGCDPSCSGCNVITNVTCLK